MIATPASPARGICKTLAAVDEDVVPSPLLEVVAKASRTWAMTDDAASYHD